MKKYIYIFASLLVLGLQSCDDFLDREPLDFGDENAYFKNAEDLKVFVNDFYSALPTNNSLWGGLYSQDNQSDNQSASYAQSLFYKGEKKTVNINNSEWNFSRLRAINYFINKVEGKLATGQLSDSPDYVNHYLGEGYFFRAYDYFRLLRNFGDAPIITVMLDDDQALLTEKSIRYPRNEVARHIIADLDKAAERGNATTQAHASYLATTSGQASRRGLTSSSRLVAPRLKWNTSSSRLSMPLERWQKPAISTPTTKACSTRTRYSLKATKSSWLATTRRASSRTAAQHTCALVADVASHVQP